MAAAACDVRVSFRIPLFIPSDNRNRDKALEISRIKKTPDLRGLHVLFANPQEKQQGLRPSFVDKLRLEDLS
jgi:hypothetical protein